jgi:CP family cyanate transporter-like MFS transporter
MATAGERTIRADDAVARERDRGGRDRERGGHSAWVFVALVLAGLGLRSAILAIGPLAPQISADLGVSHAVTGLLATLPLVLMGIAALFASAVGDLLGDRLAIGLSLAAIGVCSVLRPGSS